MTTFDAPLEPRLKLLPKASSILLCSKFVRKSIEFSKLDPPNRRCPRGAKSKSGRPDQSEHRLHTMSRTGKFVRLFACLTPTGPPYMVISRSALLLAKRYVVKVGLRPKVCWERTNHGHFWAGMVSMCNPISLPYALLSYEVSTSTLPLMLHLFLCQLIGIIGSAYPLPPQHTTT